MVNDTDDLGFLIPLASFEEKTLANRIFVREVLARKDVVHDHHGWGMLVVLCSKETAGTKANSHDVEIVWVDNVFDGPVHFASRRRFCLAFPPKEPFIVATQRKRTPTHRNRLDT